MSDTKLLTMVEKFDGTNWESFSYTLQSTLMYIDALDIMLGTSKQPTLSAPPTSDEQRAHDDWAKRSRQGNALLLTSVTRSVQQSLSITKTLKENWDSLKDTYGTCTGLNLWVDYCQYTTTTFSTDTPLTQQIDAMSELRTRIVNAGLAISDPLHTLNVLQALPASYEVVQQTILATLSDFSKIDWGNTCSRILSEELHQGTSAGIAAICARASGQGKDKCNFCGGIGHWEKDY